MQGAKEAEVPQGTVMRHQRLARAGSCFHPFWEGQKKVASQGAGTGGSQKKPEPQPGALQKEMEPHRGGDYQPQKPPIDERAGGVP